jgi:AbrB family looped-hinge helix DNA binding protein
MSTTVTSKGQVTIPKSIRDSLGLEPGSQVEFAVGADGEFILRRADGRRPESRFAQMQRFVDKEPSEMTTDEFMAFIRGED